MENKTIVEFEDITNVKDYELSWVTDIQLTHKGKILEKNIDFKIDKEKVKYYIKLLKQ
jgi:hypothetical protein